MDSIEMIMTGILIFTGSVYALVILIFTIGWHKIAMVEDTKQAETKLSIIVAMRNEENNVQTLIKNILSQDYPSKLFELILINDHSTDNTLRIARADLNNENLVIIDLEEGQYGKKQAIKQGISRSTGELIITTDADCNHGTNWLRSIDAHYTSGKFKMMSGPVFIDNASSTLSKFQSLEFISLVGSGAGAIGAGMPILCNGANLIYEKQAFHEVGGFSGNEHIPGGDDIFLLEKFKKHFGPGKIGFIKNRNASVGTGPSAGLQAFLNQRIRWVAKSPAYRDSSIIFTAIIVFLFNFCLLLTMLWAIFSMNIFIVFLAGFFVKCMVDLPLLWVVSGFFRQRKLLWYFLLFQFIYIIFSGSIAIAGNIFSYRWKR